MSRWALALAVAPLAVLLSSFVAPVVPMGDPRAGYVLAFALVSGLAMLTAASVPPLGARGLLAAVPGLALLFAMAVWGPGLPLVATAMGVTLALHLAGGTAGAVIGGAIQAPGHLLVVAVLSALVDAGSVLHPQGVSAQVIESEAAIGLLVLPFPMLGTTRIDPVLGVGDVVFLAIYFAATRKFGLPVRRTVIALALALVVTLATVLALEIGIPALPFLGAAMVVAHPEARRVPPEDRRTAWIGILAVVLVLALAFAFR